MYVFAVVEIYHHQRVGANIPRMEGTRVYVHVPMLIHIMHALCALRVPKLVRAMMFMHVVHVQGT